MLRPSSNIINTPNTFVYGEKEVMFLQEIGVFQKLIDRFGNDVEFYKAHTTIGIRFYEGLISFLVKKHDGQQEIVTAEELQLSVGDVQKLEKFMLAEYHEIANFGKPKGITATIDRVLDQIFATIAKRLSRQK